MVSSFFFNVDVHGSPYSLLLEADRLLDQGFERDLQRILSLLPNRKTSPRYDLNPIFLVTSPLILVSTDRLYSSPQQCLIKCRRWVVTILFYKASRSHSFPLFQLAATFLLPNHVNISTVAENEDSTHSHVRQEIAYVDPVDLYAAAASLVTDALVADPNGKVIAFFPTAREVALFSELVRPFCLRSARLLIFS